MSIQEHLNKIRNAIKGSEVRESIAKGIETAYDDASENGNANMEVKIARGTNPNLNTRLNKMDETDRQNAGKIDSNYNEVTAQLAQTENELNYKVDEVKFDVSQQEILFYANDQLIDNINVSEAGNTQAVMDYIDQLVSDGVIEGVTLVDGAVNADKTDFINNISNNLFNKRSVVANTRVSSNVGNLLEVEGVSTSDFIKVIPETDYHRNVLDAYAIYDANKEFIIGGASNSENTLISMPSDAAFIRLSTPDDKLNVFQFQTGSKVVGVEDYQDYELSRQIKVNDKSLDSLFTTYSESRNLFNPNDSELLRGWLLTVEGLLEREFFMTTGFINVEGVSHLKLSRKSGSSRLIRTYATYDDNKNILEVSGTGKEVADTSGDILNINKGVSYVRFGIAMDSVDLQIEVGTISTPYVPFKASRKIKKRHLPNQTHSDSLNFWSGKTVVFDGTSITQGWLPTDYDPFIPFPNLVGDMLNFEVINNAIGGSTLSEWGNDGEEPRDRTPLVTRIADLPSNVDGVVIEVGTNDWAYAWSPLGTMTDRSTQTFYGALHTLCIALLDMYYDKPILFLTPIKRGSEIDEKNSHGESLENYCKAIEEVCSYYSIDYFDAYNKSQINPHMETQSNLLIPDKVHPNQKGHENLARGLANHMK